jgi:hypothetical protein
VGDVADHDLALLLGALAAFGEVVEGGGEAADLVVGGDRDPVTPAMRAVFAGDRSKPGTGDPGGLLTNSRTAGAV